MTRTRLTHPGQVRAERDGQTREERGREEEEERPRTTRMVQERSSLQTIPHCRQTPGRRPAKAGDSYELPFTSDQADKPQVNLDIVYVVILTIFQIVCMFLVCSK